MGFAMEQTKSLNASEQELLLRINAELREKQTPRSVFIDRDAANILIWYKTSNYGSGPGRMGFYVNKRSLRLDVEYDTEDIELESKRIERLLFIFTKPIDQLMQEDEMQLFENAIKAWAMIVIEGRRNICEAENRKAVEFETYLKFPGGERKF